MKRKLPVPDDIKEVAMLIKLGRLFELQEWIDEGKRVRCPELEERAGHCLEQACRSGFHSVVQMLLEQVGWELDEKNRMLGLALEDKRVDLVELLLKHGADPRSADFADVAGTVDVELMERFMAAGCDPCRHNGFARALDDAKARPLLRFLKSRIKECPELKSQASLALASAVEEEKVRWAAMLVWAGADPLMRVPENLYRGWDDLSDYEGSVPAEVACRSGNTELLKVLKIRPTAALMQDFLSTAALYGHVEIIEMLLKLSPDLVNAGDPFQCDAIGHFLSDGLDRWAGLCGRGERDERSSKCLELLLEAGARWVPEQDNLSYLRRRFARLEPRDAVRVLRLLLYVPNAVSRSVILDFCDHTSIRRMIYRGDQKLADEMQVMWRQMA